MVFSWSFTIPLACFTSCAFGMRSDTTIIPECKDWEEEMPDKWKAKAGIVTKNRKVYLDENPDPCSQYGLQCCKGNAYWKDVKPWNVKSVTGNWAKCPRISKRRFAKIQLFAMTQSKVIFVAVPSTLVDVEVQNIHVTVVISSFRPMKPALWTKWVKHEVTVKIQMFAISLEMLIHVLMVGASGIVRTCVVRMEAVKWRDDPSLSAGKKK